MAIADLVPKQGKVEIVVEVVAKETPREFNKFGKSGRVCNATVKDDSGEIKLTLWNDDVDKVDVGDKVQISNGYVNEYQGEKQLTTGRFGSLTVISKGDKPEQLQPKAEQKKDDDSYDDASVEEENLEEF